jgi:hypothetical protein
MDTIQILYNKCYGGFKFSDDFKEELKKRLGQKIEYRHENYRDHPEAIKLFLEKGSEWSSYSYSELALYEFPKKFKNFWSIHDYDGMENIYIRVDSAIAYAVDEYLKNPTPETLESFKHEIAELKRLGNLSR